MYSYISRNVVNAFLSTTQLCHPSMIDIHSRLLTPVTRLSGRNVPGDAFPISFIRTYGRVNTCGMMMAGWRSTGQYRQILVARRGGVGRGGDGGKCCPSTLIFLWERVQMWPYPLWGLARAKGVDGVPHETRGLSLPLFSAAVFPLRLCVRDRRC